MQGQGGGVERWVKRWGPSWVSDGQLNQGNEESFLKVFSVEAL